MANVIITGATGFIGSHLAKYLQDLGWKVFLITRPGSKFRYFESQLSSLPKIEFNDNIKSLIEFFNSHKPDVVMHLASTVIHEHQSEQIPQLIDSNILFGTYLLEVMAKTNTRLFINTGTYWQNFDNTSYNPVNLYAATKEAFEKIIKYYTETFGIRAITLRLHDVYGEDDLRPKIWNILKNQKDDSSIEMTEGSQIVKLTYISDVIKAYTKAFLLLKENTEINNTIFDVSSQDDYTLKQIVKIYESILNKSFNINWGKRPFPKRQIMQPSDIFPKLPDWVAQVSIEEGFAKFKNNN